MSTKILRGKCLLIGDSTVGKSTLAQSFVSDGQNLFKNYNMTTGVEILTKLVTVPNSNFSVELIFYDCAGKECFYNLVQKTWNHPNMVVIVFDLTNDISFSTATRWLERIRNFTPDIRIPAILIGNKSDLSSRRNVKSDEVAAFCKKNDMAYFECSAKDSQGVSEAMMHVITQYCDMYKECLTEFDKLI